MNPSARTMASSVPSLDFVGDHYVMALSSSRSFQCDSTAQGALILAWAMRLEWSARTCRWLSSWSLDAPLMLAMPVDYIHCR